MSTIEKIIVVRDVNEHGFDLTTKKGIVQRSVLHTHLNENIALDETSMITKNGEIFIGPLRLADIYVAVEEMRKSMGFASLHKYTVEL